MITDDYNPVDSSTGAAINREQNELRRNKCNVLRQKGFDFNNTFRPDSTATKLSEAYASYNKEQLAEQHIVVKMAGRMMSRRQMGKASFVDLKDDTGSIQLYIRQRKQPESKGIALDVHESFLHLWDLGDLIAVEGYLFKTKTNELSVHVEKMSLQAKSLRALPDKFHGLVDQQIRYRQRYLDLLSNPESKHRFILRSSIINWVREFLVRHAFLEVETPMMHPIAGGAAAKPFVTHHHALDCSLYLRIAPELYLKRLIVGGFHRVFEIGRNFRNEGLSTRHNPEFTMVEFYQAYANYEDLITQTENLMRELAHKVFGQLQFNYQGQAINFEPPFQRMSLCEAIVHYNASLSRGAIATLPAARHTAEQLGVSYLEEHTLGHLHVELFEKTVEKKLEQPTFITHYPTVVSPLARQNDQDPSVTDRFEFFVAGQEIANGFSELNDPEEQARRFHDQVLARQSGDQEAMHHDQAYVTALEYGMPPTAGEGIGIDRLVMLLTDAPSIREVILFPLLRATD